MNNLGEAFFSAPTDPTNLMKDWGRSDNDQRHRLVISGSVNSPTTPGTTMWERLSHGFQVSTMLQYYSALPFNIVSGVNSLQGTAGRPFADGSVSTANFDVRAVDFIPRNAGAGSDFFTMSLRVSRALPARRRPPHRGDARSVQSDQPRQPDHAQHHVRIGLVSVEPVSSFNTVTAVGDPRTLQFGLRVTF